MAPKSLMDTRLSTLIEKARSSRDAEPLPEQSDSVRANAVFSDVVGAIERGLRTLDPRSREAALLERLRDELRSR